MLGSLFNKVRSLQLAILVEKEILVIPQRCIRVTLRYFTEEFFLRDVRATTSLKSGYSKLSFQADQKIDFDLFDLF